MATYSSILALRIPQTKEPGGQQSIGLQTVGQNWSNLARKYARIRVGSDGAYNLKRKLPYGILTSKNFIGHFKKSDHMDISYSFLIYAIQ